MACGDSLSWSDFLHPKNNLISNMSEQWLTIISFPESTNSRRKIWYQNKLVRIRLWVMAYESWCLRALTLCQSKWQRTNTQNYLLWWRTNIWSISIINSFCGFVLELCWLVSHQIFLFYLPIDTAPQFLYKLLLSISSKDATHMKKEPQLSNAFFSALSSNAWETVVHLLCPKVITIP